MPSFPAFSLSARFRPLFLKNDRKRPFLWLELVREYFRMKNWPRISRPLFALNPFYTMGGFSLAPLSRSIFVGTNYKSFLHQRMPSWPSNSWRRILTFEKEEVCNSFGPAPSSRETARNFSGIATESGGKSWGEPFRKTGRVRFPYSSSPTVPFLAFRPKFVSFQVCARGNSSKTSTSRPNPGGFAAG